MNLPKHWANVKGHQSNKNIHQKIIKFSVSKFHKGVLYYFVENVVITYGIK